MLENFKQVGPERLIAYKKNPDNTEIPFRFEYVSLESTTGTSFLSNLQMTDTVVTIKTGKDLDWAPKDVVLLGKETRTRYTVKNVSYDRKIMKKNMYHSKLDKDIILILGA